jgi:sulfofructose kinase
MSRIICLGHAALDRLYRIEAFPPEPTKVRALEHIESGGGMAANAAAAIARLGGKVELWSRVGDDEAGNKIKAGLKAGKVDVRHVQSFEEGRTSTAAIIVDDRGERLIVGNRDTNMPSGTSWLPLERVKDTDAVLADVRWLEGVRALFTRARADHIPTVLDADLGAREALGELLELTDYAVFSEAALKDFAPKISREAAFAKVAALGCRHVGVTLGANGYAWGDADGQHSVPAFPVDVVDTTGAGDAFHGAFVLGVAQGLAMPEIVRRAAATAAMSCNRLGSRAGLPNLKQLDAFLAAETAKPLAE